MRRRDLTRVMASALAAGMVVSMAGCGGKGGSTAETTAAPDTTAAPETTAAPAETEAAETTAAAEEEDLGAYTVRKDADGNVYDLGGMEVIIRDWFSQETEAQNAMDEAREEYLDWIQETYNFTIKAQNMSGWGDVHTDFVNYATAGGDENYIFALWQGAQAQSELDSELMYDLSSLDCLDFSESKWNPIVKDLYTFDGKVYAMNAEENEPRGGMFFNKRLLTEAGINPEDLYTWQEDGSWTWDKFEELCEQIYQDTNNDGEIDRWPIMTFNDPFYTAAVFSNGGSYVAKENGKYVNNLESAATLDAVNWARDMLTKYRKPDPQDAAWDYCYTGFINGEAAFMADEAYNAGAYDPDNTASAKFSAMKDDFGFVCFPKGPNATDYTNGANNNIYVIPGCYDADKAWKIAFAYDLYTEPTPGYEDVSSMKQRYYSAFRDMESVDLTIARMLENASPQYHTLIAGLDLGNQFLWKFSDENTPAQQAEAIRNTWNAYIAKANGEISQEQLDAAIAAEAESTAAEGEGEAAEGEAAAE